MNESDLISIIIPVYNCKNTLKKTVDSVINQTYINTQIILVDDGSSDGSEEICDALKESDHRIIVVHQHNGGVSSARNTGIQLSRGDYISFVDADDILHPAALEQMHKALIAYHKNVAVCQYVKTDGTDQISAFGETSTKISVEKSTDILVKNLYGKRKDPFCWGKLIKTELVNTLCFPELSMCEDIVFMFYVYKAIMDDIVIIKGNAPLYYYIQHENSVVHTLKPKHLLDSLKSAAIILSHAENDSTAIKNAIRCYALNAAFFAYLHSEHNEDYKEVLVQAFNMIKEHRRSVLSDFHAPVKSKAACILSMLSMKLTQIVYRVVL